MKIGIVGSGYVGATAAYAMVMGGIGREIVLVDRNVEKARAEAFDISHAVPFAHPLTVRQGEYSDFRGCRLVIISAGVSQKPGETRLELLKRNAAVFKDVVPAVLDHTGGETILVVATNPLDVMTCLAARYASEHGLAKARVLGTGNMLDTARFRTLLGEHVGVDPQHVHGYVVGEHGDSEVLAWSLVTVSAIHLENYCRRQGVPMNEGVQRDIDNRVRRAAYSIINGKGATYYGIGSAIARLVDVILHDQRSILTVSAAVPDNGARVENAYSMPRLVGGEGIIHSIPVEFDVEEERLLGKSAGIVREAVRGLEAAGD